MPMIPKLPRTYDDWKAFRGETTENLKWIGLVFGVFLAVAGVVSFLAPVLAGAFPLIGLGWMIYKWLQSMNSPQTVVNFIATSCCVLLLGSLTMILALWDFTNGVFEHNAVLSRTNQVALFVSGAVTFHAVIGLFTGWFAVFCGYMWAQSNFVDSIMQKLITKYPDAIPEWNAVIEEWNAQCPKMQRRLIEPLSEASAKT